MSKTVFTAKVLNSFRTKGPWYDKVKGHTGVDLDFVNEDLLSPITGEVLKTADQREMGKTMYLRDAWGNIHVFAHLDSFNFSPGDQVKRGEIIAKTGNTGLMTTGPHLHYEVILKETEDEEDKKMGRKLFSYKGFNTDPIIYLQKLYAAYQVSIEESDKPPMSDGSWINK